MSYGLCKPSEIPLQQIALHELAKICWGKFVLRESMSTEIPNLLVAYRDKVLNRVPQIFKELLPKILINEVIKAVFRLQQGYKDAIFWEQKYQHALPRTILNPFTAGQSQAGNFIDPTGYFNDLAWAKYFANEEKETMYFRVQIACFYGLHEEIINMWRIVKPYDIQYVTAYPHRYPFQQILQNEPRNNTLLVSHWFTELKNNDSLIDMDNSYYNKGFHVRGIRLAFMFGNEYSVRFFWTRLSDAEKQRFLKELDLEVIAGRAQHRYAGLVHFCYSLLPKERIYDFILSNLLNHEILGRIWSCLLDSPYYEYVLEEALNFLIHSSELYCVVLSSLVFAIKRYQNPFNADILKKLWDSLEEELQKQIFKESFYIVCVLIEIRRIDLLEIFIQTLTRNVKENILLDDWGRLGRSTLNEFSKIGDYGSMLRYLLCFLIDRNSRTQKKSFRIDPINFFNCYIKEMVNKWTETIISQSVKNEVNNVMNCLVRILHVTDALL